MKVENFIKDFPLKIIRELFPETRLFRNLVFVKNSDFKKAQIFLFFFDICVIHAVG